MTDSRRRGWTLAIVSVGLFMVVLDNLVVSVALPSIHRDLGASIQALEWTVNAYVLSYAVLLLTGAALGDRFGRKRMFMAGISLFTISSAAAALAPSIELLIVARAIQGFGAAVATPLTLTLLADAFPPARRGMAIGVWSGVSGIAVALGPLVGGAVVQAASWQWIFWINVPIGAVLVPLAMYFGMFGSIFFLSQFLQDVLHNTPLQAGVKLLVWTGATMVVAPLAGVFSERYGSRPFMAAGLALQAIALGWMAATASVGQSYASLIAPFILAGSGMALVFAPAANAVLASVRTDQAGQASGATNAIRELGGVLGVSVLATVFTAHGGYVSPQAFVNGLVPAMWVGVAVLGAGSLVAVALPFSTRAAAREQAATEAAAVGREQATADAAAAVAGHDDALTPQLAPAA